MSGFWKNFILQPDYTYDLNRPCSIEKQRNPSKASIGFYYNMIVNDSKSLCDKEGADSFFL